MIAVGVLTLLPTLTAFPAGQAAPPQPGASASQGGMKLPIRARTHEEYVAYQAAAANLQNPDAMAPAVADFATKFPDSNLRVLLYRKLMKSYKDAGNAEKMMDAGLKVLALDKDDPEALISVAEVQEEHTSQMDLDRDQRMGQALANAQRALQTIDTDLTIPAGATPDRVEQYKKYLRATAWAIIGNVEYRQQKYSDAEATFHKSLDADPGNPDGVVLLQLALALDQQNKYQDALAQASRAVELTKEDTDVGKLARTEEQRLKALLAKQGNPEQNPPAAEDDSTTSH